MYQDKPGLQDARRGFLEIYDRGRDKDAIRSRHLTEEERFEALEYAAGCYKNGIDLLREDECAASCIRWIAADLINPYRFSGSPLDSRLAAVMAGLPQWFIEEKMRCGQLDQLPPLHRLYSIYGE